MWSDLERPPLSARSLTRGLVVTGGPWTEVRVVAETGSTNADAAAAAAAGAPEGLVLVAESQRAGRGRLGRPWQAPPRSGLAVSVLLRPDTVPPERLGWLPLLTGLAVARSLRRVAEVDARVKWPNDVLVDERKLAGVLVERVGAAAVVGVGLNVSLRADELPVPTATSLALLDAASTDRDPLLRALLRELGSAYRGWVDAGGDPHRSGLAPAYAELSATLGREVRAELPGGRVVAGTAEAVDDAGRLVVAGQPLVAGDVVHLR